jgi:hypothetical protein
MVVKIQPEVDKMKGEIQLERATALIICAESRRYGQALLN